MSEIALKQAKELAINFAEGCGISGTGQTSFVQNAILLAQDEKTKDYDFKDVLKCLMKAEKYGVSLVKGEASMYPVNCNENGKYIKRPLLIVDYKWQWQQVLLNGDCKTFNIIPVYECDRIYRSMIGHEIEFGDDEEGEVLGYYGKYEGKCGLVIGKYMTKEQIIAKLPKNNKNAMYKGSDSETEWMFMKGVLRQMLKKIPNSEKLEKVMSLEDNENKEIAPQIVDKAAAKAIPENVPENKKEDDLY